jgi:DNA invertase Pin-like site-specific DNA recombinase
MAGLHLIGIVQDEGVSGAKKFETRPGGAEVLDSIHSHQAFHVVALKLDRLFRDAENALGQTRQWDKAGVALHVIDMGGSALNTGSAMGRMFLTMTAAFAELERNLIRERTAIALRTKKQGMKVYSPPPLGFRREGQLLIADPAETAVVERIRTMRAEGASLRAIAAVLNHDGTPTKNGASWHASTVQKVLSNSIHG